MAKGEVPGVSLLSQLTMDDAWAGAPEGVLRMVRGARAGEEALLEALAPRIEAWDPLALGSPLRVVVSSRSLREHVAAAVVRRFGAVAGLSVRTLFATALEICENAGATPRGGDALVPVLVRQEARRIPALRDRLDALDDGYGIVEAAVHDLLDAGFDADVAESVEEAVAELAPSDEARRRARAVVQVAAAVQARLEPSGVAHRSELFRRAREALERDPARGLPSRAVLVFGFADATGVQTDLLQALLRHCGATVFLDRPPDPADPERDDAGVAFTNRFAERLRQVARVERGPGVRPGRVAVLRAPGPEAEVREVASRVRALLDAGAEPERIGVVARDLAPHRLPIRTHFARLGVPFSALSARGPDGPAGRRLAALRGLLRQRERAPAELWLDAVAALRAGSDRVVLSTGARADLRLALHARGAGRLDDVAVLPHEEDGARIPLPARQGLARVGDDGAPRARRRTLGGARLGHAAAAAYSLCAALDGWPAQAPLGRHLALLRDTLEHELGWSPGDPGFAELEAWIGADPARPDDLPLSRDDFALLLERGLDGAGGVALGGEGAGVQVLSVMEARSRTFEHLFLIGLDCDAFPRPVREDPLLSDPLRRRLRAVLEDLPVKSDGFDEERHLFAQLVSASRDVTLSCAVADEDGRDRPPSPLLERLRRAPHVAEPETVPVPYAARHADASEGTALRPAHEHALQAALHGTRRQFASALRVAVDDLAVDLALSDPAALAAARVAVLEELDPGAGARRGPGPYFGFVGAPSEAADPRRAPLYVTTVESAARCPWQTFLGRLLRLELTPDALDALPSLAPQLAMKWVGMAVHRAVEQIAADRIAVPAKTLEEAAAREPTPIPWPGDAELESVVRAAAEAVLREEGIATPGFDAALAGAVRARLEVLRTLEWSVPGAARPFLGVELPGSVVVNDASGAERWIHFRADTVERGEDVLVLTDVKTGRPLSDAKTDSTRAKHHADRVACGEQLQAVAYALAGRALGGPGAIGRYVYLTPDEVPERVFPVGADAPELEAAFTSAARAVLEVWDRGAFFPRLEQARDRAEPFRCQTCEVKDACLRGDSGARARLADFAGSDAAPASAAEAALRGLWRLGEDA